MILSLWIFAVVIQVAITSFLAFQFTKYRSEKAKIGCKFSIVVAAHNELENLQNLIPELLKQTHNDFEVIIVLDRCSDSSYEFLSNQESGRIKIIEVKATQENFDHKKYALTEGVKQASGDWIVFTDADCVPNSSEWLNSIENRIAPDIKIVLGYSPYTSNGSLLQNFIQFEGFITAFNYLSISLFAKPYMGVGRNLCLEKNFFIDKKGYKGFQSVLGGDDDLFIQANAIKENTAIVLGENAMIYTKPKKLWSHYIQQKTRHLSVGTSYSTRDILLHTLFNSSLFVVWSLLPFFNIEFILPIILFYLSVKWIGYRFAHSKMGAGFNYILLPLVDVMYAIFIPIIAIRSKLVKDIRWKN
jgi:glycosyltransferase involved in cell wall biosynthesis